MGRAPTVMLLSGPVSSGKTILAEKLVQRYAGEHISTSGLISKSAGRRLGRTELQTLGLYPSFQEGEWIADAVTEALDGDSASEVVVVDAV